MKISGDTKIFEFVTDEIGTKEYFDKLSLNGDLDDKLKGPEQKVINKEYFFKKKAKQTPKYDFEKIRKNVLIYLNK